MSNGDGRAVASLVCGILSWITCPIFLAIVAIALGTGSRNGLARAGVILGWLNILAGLAGLVFFLLAGFGAAVFGR